MRYVCRNHEMSSLFLRPKIKKIHSIYHFFFEDKALIVMCYAIRLQLTTPDHLWILPSWYSDGWWNNADKFNWTTYSYSCTGSEIKDALVNSILLDVYPYFVNPNSTSVSGYVSIIYTLFILNITLNGILDTIKSSRLLTPPFSSSPHLPLSPLD